MQLNFESETFAGIKRDMNFVLQRLLGNMQEKGATNGSMTLKIDVSFDTEYIPNYDPQIEGESRKIEKPKFKHEVTSTVQIKDKKSGNMDTEMELVFDEDTGEYVMKPIANTEQRSIFDSDFGKEENPAGKEEEKKEENSGTRALPGPVKSPDDVIDAEFREVSEDSADVSSDSGESGDGQENPDEELEDVTDELLGDDDNSDDDDYSYEEPEGEE